MAKGRNPVPVDLTAQRRGLPPRLAATVRSCGRQVREGLTKMAMRRRAVVVGVLVGLVAMTGASTVSAAPPAWPASGYRPLCDSVIVGASPVPSSPFALTFADNTPPTIASLSVSPKVVIGPDAKQGFFLKSLVNDSCSGVQSAIAIVYVNGTANTQWNLYPQTDDAFHASMTYSSGALSLTTMPAKITVPYFFAWDRYSSVTLDTSDQLLTSTPRLVPIDIGGLWSGSTPITYLVEESKLAATASAKQVKQGATVKFTATLTAWNSPGFIAHSGAPLQLQRKVGAAWTTVASGVTDATGKATLAAKVTKTGAYRVAYAQPLVKGFDTQNSTPVTVTAR